MKYQKKISVGAWLKPVDDFNEDDFVEIANEGKQVPSDFGTQNAFLIKTEDGKEGNVGFNQTTINNLVDGYGEDSINWIGKKVKVWRILQNVQGKMKKVNYFLHPDTVLDEATQSFIIPNKVVETKPPVKSEDIPVVEDDNGIDVKKIPF